VLLVVNIIMLLMYAYLLSMVMTKQPEALIVFPFNPETEQKVDSLEKRYLLLQSNFINLQMCYWNRFPGDRWRLLRSVRSLMPNKDDKEKITVDTRLR